MKPEIITNSDLTIAIARTMVETTRARTKMIKTTNETRSANIKRTTTATTTKRRRGTGRSNRTAKTRRAARKKEQQKSKKQGEQ